MHHNLSKSREYKAWQSLKTACYNKNNSRYKTWGAKGFTICERWEDFCNFIEDMGEIPIGCTGVSIKSDIFREFNALTAEWRWNGAGRPRIDKDKPRYKKPRGKVINGVQICLSIPKDQLDYVKKVALQMGVKSGKHVEVNDLIRQSLAKAYPLPNQIDMFGGKI